LQTNENISAAAGGDNYYEGSPTNALVKMDDGGREDSLLSVQEPLIDANSLYSDVHGLESSGDTCVDYSNDTLLTTSQVNEANQMKVPYNPFKATWKSSTGKKVPSGTVSAPLVESSLASLLDTLNSSSFQASKTPLQTNINNSAFSGKADYGRLPLYFVKTDDGGREDPSPSVQEPLMGVNRPNSDA